MQFSFILANFWGEKVIYSTLCLKQIGETFSNSYYVYVQKIYVVFVGALFEELHRLTVHFEHGVFLLQIYGVKSMGVIS